ncbi:hypothetical protein [Rhizobium leguminosarum]|uniref:hypothetical protein n=1 Tax=Rhizobium leguminosarum TaxID=384 RepID=UPI003F96A170
MFNFRFYLVVAIALSLSACQVVPDWKMETKFPFKKPVIQAICEIATAFNKTRQEKTFPNSYYVITITLETRRENSIGAGINTFYKSRDGDEYVAVGSGEDGIGGSRLAWRLSTAPVTFELTDLAEEAKKLDGKCNGAHAADTDLTAGKEVASFGLDQWFKDVMFASPVGLPDGPTTTLYLEHAGWGTVSPAWKFVRGFVDPSIGANYKRYDQLKVEIKSPTGQGEQAGGDVKVTRGNSTTNVPATTTESYRNSLQQRIIIDR